MVMRIIIGIADGCKQLPDMLNNDYLLFCMAFAAIVSTRVFVAGMFI